MQDFGLREACNSHAVVLLDTCALHLPEIGCFFKDGAICEYPARSELDHTEYLRYINTMLQDALLITPGVSVELKNFGEVAKKHRIPNTQKKLISQACDLARSRRVISYTEEEGRLMEDASLYFKFFKRFMSKTDYEILMSSIATATYRGSSGVLTNDSGIINAFESMTKFLRKGYVNHGLPQVQYPIVVYSIMWNRKFSRQAFYNPQTRRQRRSVTA